MNEPNFSNPHSRTTKQTTPHSRGGWPCAAVPWRAHHLRSKRERARAPAAAHANREDHLLIHAFLTTSLKSSGSSLASATRWSKEMASLDHLPPTSYAITTSRARPCPCATSGYLRSLCLHHGCTVGTCALASGGAVPRQWRHHRGVMDTIVVSMASWTPRNNGSPSDTTSMRRLSTSTRGRSPYLRRARSL